MPRRRTHASLAFMALAAMTLSLACDDGPATPSTPPLESVLTAESVSRAVVIAAPISTTPEAEDAGETPIALDARIFGSGPTGVILAHERPADQTSWFPFATRLAAAGAFTVMTFDFRGYGDSTGDKDFDRIDTDLAAAYDYMRDTLHIGRIFLIGASIGGTASLVVASRSDVAGVVSISSPAQFESMDALSSVGQILAPKLFVTSQNDVPAQRSQHDLLEAATEPKDEQVYDGNAHGTDLFSGPHAEELERRLVDFLKQH